MTPEAIDALFEAQLQAWPELRAGVESLARMRRRELDIHGVRCIVLHIPHRIGSTTASTDPDSIRERSCFLCARNRPPEQRGLPFGEDIVALCNPFPILDRHLTLVYRDHVPQRIVGGPGGGIRAMLDAARALPGFMVLYNGARCGASAPDHLHFQACRYAGVPVIDDLPRAAGGMIPDYLRSVLVLSSSDVSRIESRFEALMSILPPPAPVGDPASPRDEAMVNILAFHDAGRWTVLVFPRVKHRPDVYHDGTLTWSPGAIDMGGTVVLPIARDLEKITPDDIRAVFREVSLDPGAAKEILCRWEAR